MSKNECAIGIDLGTTNSCVAIYKSDGQVDIIVNDDGKRTTPSYVSFQGEERYIGEAAKKSSGQNPKNTVFDVKRFIGAKYSSDLTQTDIKHVSYNVVPDGADNPLVEVEYMNKTQTFHPEEISSMILSKLKETACKYLGQEITKAVITVPAYFNDSQRQATKHAGEIAGLEVIRIINEPTAAAIAYGLDTKKEDCKVLVYDIGGGTLDVTILNIDGGIFTVVSTNGDTHLGGEDFDNRLKDYVFMKFCDKAILKTKLPEEEKHVLLGMLDIKSLAGIQDYGTDKLRQILEKGIENPNIKQYIEQLLEVNILYKNIKLMRRLKTACEDTKIQLSTMKSANIVYDNFYNGEDLNIKISRSKFEQICKQEFDRCIVPVDKALADAKMAPLQINDVVLVGGTTRVPKIRELLDEKFPNKLRSNINPDEAVAHGAAVNAAIISNTGDKALEGLVLIDVTPLSLGIETAGGLMERMIPRNSALPAEAKQTFSTNIDNQPSVTVKVFEGERSMTKYNNELGKFELTDLPLMPKNKPRIEVIFSVDTNGIMSVSAKELSSGVENAVSIRNEKGRLSVEKIAEMIEKAEEFKENDKKIKDRIDAKNSLEMYLDSCNKTMSNEEFRTFVSDEKLSELTNLLMDVRTMIEDWEDDDDEISLKTNQDYDEQYKLVQDMFLPIFDEITKDKQKERSVPLRDNLHDKKQIDNNDPHTKPFM